MINKEVLAQFVSKPIQPTENLFTTKKLEIYYSMYIEERGWVKAKIPSTNWNILRLVGIIYKYTKFGF